MRQGLLGWLGKKEPKGDEGEPVAASGELKELEVASIRPNPGQPRREFSEEDLADLIASIASNGIVQPLVVRPVEGGYELIAGERRLRAAQRLGWRTVPAMVREANQREAALMAVIENVQRKDLSFMEEALAYQRLLEEFDLTQEELATRVGKKQPTIANKLRLLRLPESVQEMIQNHQDITERHARALLAIEQPDLQRKVLEEVVRNRLNTQQTEELIEAMVAGEEMAASAGKQKVVRVFRDVRIFLNSFREVVRTLRRSGIEAEMREEEDGDSLIVTVVIPRARQR